MAAGVSVLLFADPAKPDVRRMRIALLLIFNAPTARLIRTLTYFAFPKRARPPPAPQRVRARLLGRAPLLASVRLARLASRARAPAPRVVPAKLAVRPMAAVG